MISMNQYFPYHHATEQSNNTNPFSMMRHSKAVRFLTLWLFSIIASTLLTFVTIPTKAGAADRPNILFLFLDDATYDELGSLPIARYFPNMKKYVQDKGVRFTNFHSIAPLCGPARASLFRGQYPHNSGVKVNALGWKIFHDNGYTDAEMGMWMREAGYTTALVGKYCHEEYPVASRDPAYHPPGWDEFHASLGGDYFDLPRVSNGDRSRTRPFPLDYRTDMESQTATEIVNQHDYSSPLFLYIAPFAPHYAPSSRDPMSHPRHADLFSSVRLPRVPSLNEADVSDKTQQYASLSLRSAAEIRAEDERFRERLRSIAAVDELLGDVVDALNNKGQLDNTYIFLTSDNGFQQGHHRDFGKKDPFDRTTRVELLVAGPGITPDTQYNHLLGHIDLAPTFLSIANAPAPHYLDGKSFMPLLMQPDSVPEAQWRESLLIENTERKKNSYVDLDLNYVALRRYDDIFVRWANGENEYYDLSSDPWQLSNQYANLPSSEQQALNVKLDEFIDCSGTECLDDGNTAPNNSRLVTTIRHSNDTGFDSNNIVLRGNSRSNVPVDKVEIVIRRVHDRKYWQGDHFVDDYSVNQSTLEELENNRYRWSYATQLPPEGQAYWVSARTTDSAGLQDPLAATAFFTVDLPLDKSKPVATVEYPADTNNMGTPTTLSGEAFDNIEIDRVELAIRNTDSGHYFNGLDYQPDYTRILVDSEYTSNQSLVWTSPTLSLEAGSHRLGIWAFDKAGNRSATDILTNITEGTGPDNTAPTGVFATPEQTGSQSNPPRISGTAEDFGSGLQQVGLVVRDLTSKRYWNGISFQNDRVVLQPVITGPNRQISWYYDFPISLGSGDYFAGLQLQDNAGNNTVVGHRFALLSADQSPPALSISEPESNRITSNTFQINGSTSDESGISHVRIAIRDLGTRRFWNGSGFQSTATHFEPTILANESEQHLNWRYGPFSLHSSRYILTVDSYDTSFNETTETLELGVGPDNEVPPAAFLRPASSPNAPPYRLRGEVLDDVGATRLELTLRSSTTQLYWNGSSFQEEYTRVLAPLGPFRPTTGWSYAVSRLPADDYYLGMWAYDGDGLRSLNSDSFTITE
ncbi:sulfatase-like hydrolase/transferase [Granulosicoccus sp. 3-233]|uniref:sulfatase-like hydrolase/transferase n=1 Tax=Granulosicoccus sp. 3-233 TaxID=3417969 RepID=UPI003D328221